MLHGCRLFSEEIFNEYAVQKCFSRAKCFRLKKGQKKPDIVWLLWFSKTAKTFKKSQDFKIWLQKTQIGNPASQFTEHQVGML